MRGFAVHSLPGRQVDPAARGTEKKQGVWAIGEHYGGGCSIPSTIRGSLSTGSAFFTDESWARFRLPSEHLSSEKLILPLTHRQI